MMKIKSLLIWIIFTAFLFSKHPDMNAYLAIFNRMESLVKVQVKIMDQLDLPYQNTFAENPKPIWFYLNVAKSTVADSVNAISKKIYTALKEHDFTSARQLALKIDNMFPGNSFTLTILGEIAKKQYDYFKAADLFRKALKVNPYNDLAYIGLARTYDNLGQKDEIRSLFLKGLALNMHYYRQNRYTQYLLHKYDWNIHEKWFIPRWVVARDSAYLVKSEIWKDFVLALELYKTFSNDQLEQITGYKDRFLAVYAAAIMTMLAEAKSRDYKDPLIKRLEEIVKDDLLIPFIENEIFIYFPEYLPVKQPVELEKYTKYFQKYYLMD